MTAAGLEFWLHHVAAAGGLWEPAGESAYVVLPPALRDAYDLPDELRVTPDPDVAREDGATLLAPGHPVLARAAERVLAAGDAGHLVLARPSTDPPGMDALLSEVRDAFPVSHGRIDLTGEVTAVMHPVIRVGAAVTYQLSTDDRFQEQAERWVDVPASLELPAALSGQLSRAAAARGGTPHTPDGLPAAVAEAHRLIGEAAAARREALATQVSGAHETERIRAALYYAAAIAGIEQQLTLAASDRAAALRARLGSIRQERGRRLAEIADRYEARHEIRPYRLHVVEVPALRVPADIRRGGRRYRMAFDWLLPARSYAPARCPSCGAAAPLVAGKQQLGCTACLPLNARI